jgi:hypothetical protein
MKSKNIGFIIILLIGITLSIIFYGQFKTLHYYEQKKKETFFLQINQVSRSFDQLGVIYGLNSNDLTPKEEEFLHIALNQTFEMINKIGLELDSEHRDSLPQNYSLGFSMGHTRGHILLMFISTEMSNLDENNFQIDNFNND